MPKSKDITNFQKLREYMFLTLKEMYISIRHLEFKFARSGVVISAVLILVSAFFFLGPYLFTTGSTGRGIELASFTIYPNALGVLISIFIAFVEIYLWFLVGIKVTPSAAHYLVDNKILKLVFTKGNVHYIEFIPEEKRKIAMSHILNKYIALIIAWVSLSAFLLQIIAGIMLSGDPTRIINPGNDFILFFIRTIVIFAFVPVVFTLVYPVGWILIDAKLKAYNSFSKLNWLVGKKVINMTAGIITIGSIIGLGATADVLTDPLYGLQLILDLILFCIINVSLIVALVAIFYNIFFQGLFYDRIVESIDIGFGITDVTLVDSTGELIPRDKKVVSTLEESSEGIVSNHIDSKIGIAFDEDKLPLMTSLSKSEDLETDTFPTEEE
ncbi:MAG: hypothetical protein ACXAB2_15990 [Candidatus Hodarchaeales archaeon]